VVELVGPSKCEALNSTSIPLKKKKKKKRIQEALTDLKWAHGCIQMVVACTWRTDELTEKPPRAGVTGDANGLSLVIQIEPILIMPAPPLPSPHSCKAGWQIRILGAICLNTPRFLG
jgi:hypothetical protein